MSHVRAGLDAHGLRVTVLVSRFNEELCALLERGALAELRRLGLTGEQLRVISVPGALELPWAAAECVRAGGLDALVVLGVVIRGETTHYDLVARECARGICEVSRSSGVPAGFGVLTTENEEQALERAHPDRQDKGGEAARVAVEMAILRAQLGSSPGER